MAGSLRPFGTALSRSTFTQNAILWSGVSLGVAGITFSSEDNSVLCESPEGASDSAFRTYVKSADCQFMIERMVIEKIKTLCAAEQTRIHQWASEEAQKAISAKVPEAAKKAAIDVEQDIDLTQAIEKATAKLRTAVKEQRDNVWWNAKNWAQAETSQRIETDLQNIISNDPKLQRIIGEHLTNVRLTSSQEVDRLIGEITEEDRLHKVNLAVLAVLHMKKDLLLSSSDDKNTSLIQETRLGSTQSLDNLASVLDSRVGRGTEAALMNARIGQVLGGVAVLGVAALIGGPYVGLHIRK